MVARPAEQVAPERAVAVLLIDPFGAILLQLRDANTRFSPNQWAVIGGGLEADEDPDQGARRELRDETGLVAEGPLSVVAGKVWPASYGVGWSEWHVYAAATSATDSDVVLGEGREIRFVPAAEVATLELGISASRFVPDFLSSPLYERLKAEAAQRL